MTELFKMPIWPGCSLDFCIDRNESMKIQMKVSRCKLNSKEALRIQVHTTSHQVNYNSKNGKKNLLGSPVYKCCIGVNYCTARSAVFFYIFLQIKGFFRG